MVLLIAPWSCARFGLACDVGGTLRAALPAASPLPPVALFGALAGALFGALPGALFGALPVLLPVAVRFASSACVAGSSGSFMNRLSTITAMTLGAPIFRCGVRSKPNGVKPVLLTPRSWPLR